MQCFERSVDQTLQRQVLCGHVVLLLLNKSFALNVIFTVFGVVDRIGTSHDVTAESLAFLGAQPWQLITLTYTSSLSRNFSIA